MAITYGADGGAVMWSSTTPQAIPIPGAAVADDFLLLTISGRALAQIPYAVTAGWTEVLPAEGNAGQTLYQLYKVHSGSETDPTVDASSATNGTAARVTAWRGVDPANPLDVAAVTNEASGVAMVASDVTTVTDSAMILRVYAFGVSTTPGTASSIVDAVGTPTVPVNEWLTTFIDQTQVVTYVEQATAGATGIGEADGYAANQWIAQTIALRPAAGASGAPVVLLGGM